MEQVVFSSGQSPATKKEGKKKRKRREEVEKNEAQPEQRWEPFIVLNIKEVYYFC